MKSIKTPVDALALQSILAQHLPLYQARVPYYQAFMLESISELWEGGHERLLDIGGGTGVIAQAISCLFPVGQVQAIDVVDRFCPDLSIATSSYNGETMPFPAGAFDAATLINVLHHVPVAQRAQLLREIRRVVDGPLYIKDHLSAGGLDHLRLTALDAMGNIPFGGMIKAQYLSAAEWRALAEDSGWRIGAIAAPRPYRAGIQGALFPNRLETAMRFDRA